MYASTPADVLAIKTDLGTNLSFRAPIHVQVRDIDWVALSISC